MPYKSLKQEKFFNANKKKLQAKGVNVDEWNKASKGKKLPMKKTKWEGSKADKKMDKKMGYKEGSKKDNAIDKKMAKKKTGKGMLASAMSKFNKK